ncbi:hypothetical protein NI17_014370 [Thermobifida halotolerans]|uniref:histidine kinase n=1 Tax=Thermobifida halotolerans TaxID=483545 RepID=A0AA97LTZ1_9ACTN|nr:ATP-binding protein [Thermobifida halotolerans]UOE18037.1 hypothetical protein NI17_014370 [Thermobifida halotolerans]
MAQVPSPGEHTGHPLSHMMQAEADSSRGGRSGTRRLFSRILARLGKAPKASAPPAAAPYGYPPAPQQGYHYPPEYHPRAAPPSYGYAPPSVPHGYPQPPYGQPPAPAPQAPGAVLPAPADQQAPQSDAPPAPAAPPASDPAAPEAALPAPSVGEPATPDDTAEPVAAHPVVVEESVRPDDVTTALASLAMRDLTLVESLLDIVEELEDTTEDSDLLGKLFKIDNLATRMRRNGENLLILAGQDTGDPHLEPVPLLDVCRAAISEIGDYERVRLGRMPTLFVAGRVSDDLSHLLAELLDNATAKSPDYAQVVISAQAMSGERLLITVEDEGIGIPDDQLAEINRRLEGPPVLEEDVIRHMGMFVVGRIAHRHGFEVQLQARAFRGISAHVVVPTELVSTTGPEPEPEPVIDTTSTAPVTVSPSPMTSPTSRAPQNRDDSGPAFTAAGLPRRGAHRTNQPALPMTGAESADGAAEPEDAESRAASIRADLEEFLEGERAATEDE